MKRFIVLFMALVLLSSHDMYLKLDSYFLSPDSKAVIQLFNGTFDRSDNVIDRYRMLDVSIIGNGERLLIDSGNWYEDGKTTFLNIETGKPGTYATGVSTKPRSLGMSAEAFNDYLKHDGVLDMLAWREEHRQLADSAVERYSKHVKTIFQVGGKLTNDFSKEFGYPIEFIPLENPYDLHPGHFLPVKLLFNQEPLANQLVYVGFQPTENEHSHDGQTHSHDDATDHAHDEFKQFRTDENGLLEVPITSEGVWYLRTIHLVEVKEEGLTHESNWATLTFAVGSGHAHEEGKEPSAGPLPGYLYGVLGLLLVGLLFLYFRKRSSA